MVIQKIPLKKILSYKQGPICVCVLNPHKNMAKETKKRSHIVHVGVKIIILAMFLDKDGLLEPLQPRNPQPKTSYNYPMC